MANEVTIPALPCQSIDEILAFYTALGFDITYHQAKPNAYAVVQREDICLHFFAMKGLNPPDSYSTCLITVPDIDGLYQAFVGGLREHYGKLPAAGIPRINRLRNRADGGRGFNVIDPGGNWIRIIQNTTISANREEVGESESHLSRAMRTAYLLSDSKNDYAAAAKLLDKALAKDEEAPLVHRVQVLIYRAELAAMMEDTELASKILHDVEQITLSEDERATLSTDLQRASDIRNMLP